MQSFRNITMSWSQRFLCQRPSCQGLCEHQENNKIWGQASISLYPAENFCIEKAWEGVLPGACPDCGSVESKRMNFHVGIWQVMAEMSVFGINRMRLRMLVRTVLA
jgi:hypothetical protein